MARKPQNLFEGGLPSFRLHGEMLATSLLALLRDLNAHGYELSKRLAEQGLPAFDTGTIYRTLRQLEEAGLISSMWDLSESGPARRRYALTKTGEAVLSAWTDVFRRYQELLTPNGSKRNDEHAGSP